MPRPARPSATGALVHVFNRAISSRHLFASADEYLAFTRLMVRELLPADLAVVAWCLLPNHWHLLLRELRPGAVSRGIQRLAAAHARAWHRQRGSSGRGHVYQGRFGMVAVGTPRHATIACGYIERNAVSSGLVRSTRDWRWSSIGAPELVPLDDAIERGAGWTERLDAPLTHDEEVKLRRTAMREWERRWRS